MNKFWLSLILILGSGTFTAYANDVEVSESNDEWEDWDDEAETSSWEYYGFLEGAYGRRTKTDPAIEKSSTLKEIRGRLALNYQNPEHPEWRFESRTDLLFDNVINKTKLNVRVASVDHKLNSSMDIKLGRQVLTWGTGDYVFLNDLFPKDWQSFFSGRDDEYLKASSNSIKASWYHNDVSIHLVSTPEFTPDEYINGERFSYFSPRTAAQAANKLSVDEASDPTWAMKVASTHNNVEYALYGYWGRWNTPVGVNTVGKPYFPKLSVWGASILSPLASGVFNSEIAWYDSREDRSGNNPAIANSQFRALIGYERELISNLTLSGQYYLERTLNHKRLTEHSRFPQFEPKQNRQLMTMRLTWQTLQQTLTWKLFSFWSPTDKDFYLKPSVIYQMNDQWQINLGANVFGGSKSYSFFGQHRDNSNVWLRIRASY
ncbi:hypothetical protein [Parashewanella tropica]|uniref:hypothetical protein n=1 Tax=Parashewanella tropica TaxID=2547970 RepID=UPI00105A1A18|nr:hypothetical protein [Parashewanella tropica]